MKSRLNRVKFLSGKSHSQVARNSEKTRRVGRSDFRFGSALRKAKEVFRDDLERVIYCPVISDTIPSLNAYVNEYLEKLKPVAFQFRMESKNSKTFRLLPRVLASGSKAFVAATWANHTAGHDDRASFFDSPDSGRGWLTRQGFSIIETNFLRDLINYLCTQKSVPARRKPFLCGNALL